MLGEKEEKMMSKWKIATTPMTNTKKTKAKMANHRTSFCLCKREINASFAILSIEYNHILIYTYLALFVRTILKSCMYVFLVLTFVLF